MLNFWLDFDRVSNFNGDFDCKKRKHMEITPYVWSTRVSEEEKSLSVSRIPSIIHVIACKRSFCMANSWCAIFSIAWCAIMKMHIYRIELQILPNSQNKSDGKDNMLKLHILCPFFSHKFSVFPPSSVGTVCGKEVPSAIVHLEVCCYCRPCASQNSSCIPCIEILFSVQCIF